MEVILYIAAIIAAIGFLFLCVSVGMTLFSLKSILSSLSGTLSGIEKQMEGITRETTSLLIKTNSLAEDIQEKSEQLNSVVHAVKGMGESVNGLNASVQQITSSISKSVEQNEEKIAQVVQWSNVAMGIADKWKKRKIIEQAPEIMPEDVYNFEQVQSDKPKRKWGRKK
ncbi:DUF948 domain-containing protein [Lysinibacillus sp. FSL K6-3209]|uniref:DUF948 domain-containing protein n=1 Tax=Lysinibacillus sp. FSL K6-3209 TaxID=2921497 RepID=UPI0030DBD473